MDTLTATEPKQNAEAPAPPAPDYSKPVVKPKQGALEFIRGVLDHGGPGYLQLAITHICNARCDFCGLTASTPSSAAA